jgi:cytochrome c oxidase subunit 2
MLAPERIWWKPLHRYEKTWVIVAFIWCLMLSAMMPIWFMSGRQNVPTETYRTTPAEYKTAVDAFVAEYDTGEKMNGVPIVAPPPGSDIYLLARQWQWYPIMQLEEGEEYRLHISSLDVQHGFSLQPVNLNLQILPGYDYVATISPTTNGEFSIVCNEYCMIGHHLMLGKIFVE